MPIGDHFLVASPLDLEALGVVLAGGRSSRFGTDKVAAILGGETLLSRVCGRAAPQVASLLINRNDGEPIDRSLQHERLPDGFPGEGPLAGILAGLARARVDNLPFLVTFACDTPFIFGDTVERLRNRLRTTEADYCVARSRGVEHRTIALWRTRCYGPLQAAFSNGLRSLYGVSEILHKTIAEFPMRGEGPDMDAFFNINSVGDLDRAERWVSAQNGSTNL